MLDIQAIVSAQRQFFQTGKTKDIQFRIQYLQKLHATIRLYESQISVALKQDLHKSELESYATEIGFVLAEITHTLKHLRAWMKPKRAKTPLTHFGSTSTIYSEPYGVVLDIAPWNYPFQLAIAPMVAAIAAGNTVVLKPSELSVHTSAVLSKLIKEVFPPEYVTVVEGGVEVSTLLLQQQFDYIFYTGGGAVGKVVMEAAAKHLTPVTLELGGKSPCIVHHDADLKLAAKRITWGKFINAGQTCVAPDYLLVHHSVKKQLVTEMVNCVQQFYGEQTAKSEMYPRIINDRHFQRISALLTEGNVLYGGESDAKDRYIAPTLLDQIDWHSPVMQEEIFGPVLPIIEFGEITEVINSINAQPKPLALYLFTNDPVIERQVLSLISFGGGCINDTLLHLASPYLPFGGVGGSGMGAYHGKSGYDLFSHHKSVLKQTTWFDLPFRYLNTKNGLKKIKFFMK